LYGTSIIFKSTSALMAASRLSYLELSSSPASETLATGIVGVGIGIVELVSAETLIKTSEVVSSDFDPVSLLTVPCPPHPHHEDGRGVIATLLTSPDRWVILSVCTTNWVGTAVPLPLSNAAEGLDCTLTEDDKVRVIWDGCGVSVGRALDAVGDGLLRIGSIMPAVTGGVCDVAVSLTAALVVGSDTFLVLADSSELGSESVAGLLKASCDEILDALDDRGNVKYERQVLLEASSTRESFASLMALSSEVACRLGC
jgi:hypothetical protein